MRSVSDQQHAHFIHLRHLPYQRLGFLWYPIPRAATDGDRTAEQREGTKRHSKGGNWTDRLCQTGEGT